MIHCFNLEAKYITFCFNYPQIRTFNEFGYHLIAYYVNLYFDLVYST